MLAVESAGGPGDVVIVLVVTALSILAIVVILVHRAREARDRQTVEAGSDIRPSAAGTRPRTAGVRPRRPSEPRTDEPRTGEPRTAGAPVEAAPPRAGTRRRFPSVGLGRQVQQVVLRKRTRTPPEPRLTDQVLIHGPWFSAVCHGYYGPPDGDRLVVRAASLRGLRHRHDGTPCQDALGVVWNERRKALYAVVADGLGSLAGSGDAARQAVEAALSCGRALGKGDDAAEMLTRAGDSVQDFNGRAPEKGTATMVVAEIRRGRSGFVLTTWGVGDSEAWLLNGGRWSVMHHERRTRSDNVTRHLPDVEARRAQRTLAGGSVVLLASDGFAGALDPGSPLGRELAGRWQKPPTPLDFLAQVDFEDDLFTDDRAAVAVWIA